MKFLSLCLVIFMNFILLGCNLVAVIVPTSQINYYHKENAFVEVGFNMLNINEDPMRNVSIETHFWVDKFEKTDMGIKIDNIFTESYNSFGILPFYRKWFLVNQDFPLGNIGIGGMFLYSNDRRNEVAMGGIEGFSSVGFFDKNLSASLIGRFGLGIGRLKMVGYMDSEYLPIMYFGFGPQLVINFEVGGIGFGISGDLQPVVGGDWLMTLFSENPSKVFVISSFLSVSMNLKF